MIMIHDAAREPADDVPIVAKRAGHPFYVTHSDFMKMLEIAVFQKETTESNIMAVFAPWARARLRYLQLPPFSPHTPSEILNMVPRTPSELLPSFFWFFDIIGSKNKIPQKKNKKLGNTKKPSFESQTKKRFFCFLVSGLDFPGRISGGN